MILLSDDDQCCHHRQALLDIICGYIIPVDPVGHRLRADELLGEKLIGPGDSFPRYAVDIVTLVVFPKVAEILHAIARGVGFTTFAMIKNG